MTCGDTPTTGEAPALAIGTCLGSGTAEGRGNAATASLNQKILMQFSCRFTAEAATICKWKDFPATEVAAQGIVTFKQTFATAANPGRTEISTDEPLPVTGVWVAGDAPRSELFVGGSLLLFVKQRDDGTSGAQGLFTLRLKSLV